MDALSYGWGGGLTALSFRRGWTHGVLAVAVLPLLLVAVMLAWHWAVGRRLRAEQAPPVRPAQLWLLAGVSVLTHPLLDFMNTYGMRWLMPFVNRWYYGDALFIVDPWIWAVLLAGILGARWRGAAARGTLERSTAPWRGPRMNPAAVSLLAVGLYAGAMLTASTAARNMIVHRLRAQGSPPRRVMVSPVPVNPFRRLVVLEDGDRYRFGNVNWLRRPAFVMEPYSVAKNADAPAARAAAESPEGRVFLRWARFPFYAVEESRGTTLVHLVDARYTLDPEAGFGAVTVAVGR